MYLMNIVIKKNNVFPYFYLIFIYAFFRSTLGSKMYSEL